MEQDVEMAYQVIARKWRPQKFSDMVGQEHIARTLRNAIISLISDGRIIKRMRKKVVSPGEMERVSVQKSLIGSELKLEVAENDET